MAEVGSATVAIVPTFSGFRSKVAAEADGSGKESGGRFSSAFKGIVGPAMALVASGVFAGFVAEAARASDATDKFKSTMNFAGIDASGIDAATKAAKAYADQTVYDLPTIQATMAQLASNGVTNYTDLTQAAGNLNAVAGGNAETFKSVSRTLTQSAGAGKLMTEDWNMLADAIPGASGPLQKVMKEAGAFSGNFKDAMAAGEISSEEFQAALSKLGNDPVAVEAARSVTTFEGAIGNLEATINSGLMSALDAMKPAITGAINLLSGGLGKAFEWTGKAATGLVDLLVKGDFTGALGEAFNVEEDSPLVGALFTIRSYATDVAAGFRAFGAAWRDNNGDVTSDGFAGVMERIANGAREVTGGFRAMFAAFRAGGDDVTSGGLAGYMERFGLVARQVWDALKPLGSTLSTVFAWLGPQLAGVMPLLSPFGLVFQALLPVLPQIAALVAGLAAQIGPLLGGALGQVTPLVGLLVSTLSGVFVAIMPGVTAMVVTLSGAMAQIIPVVMGVIASIMPLVATLLTQLAPIITNLVTSILPPVVSIFGNIVNAIAPLITQLAAVLIPIIQALLPVVVTVFGVIASVITAAMQIVQGIIQVVTGLISGNWSKVWTGIGNILSGVWNTIVALVKGALQIVGQVVISGLGLVGNFVGDVLGNIGRFFSDTWNNITRGVGGFIDGFMRFFLDLPGKIQGALSGAGEWLLGIGKNIIDGLINGITGMAGTVARAILNLIPEAIRGPIEAALGIHSPSRVAMWWGEMIGDGLSGGIDGSQRKVAASMNSLVSTPSLPGMPGSTSAAYGNSGINVTINQVDDPIGTAHAVARRLRAVSV